MRKERNYIKGIMNFIGHWTENESEIKQTFLDYFKTIFSSSRPSPLDINEVTNLIPNRVSAEANNYLTSIYTEQEIVTAVNQMFPTKSPGPDGFPPLFYQRYWGTVGPKTVAACLSILNHQTSIQQ